jgi:hypothetical protein
MNFTKTKLATLATLSLGALTTVAALARAGGFSVLLSGFTLFALLPYVLFCGACFLAVSSRGRAITTLLVSAAATVFALLVYGDLIFIHPGSMSGLAFLFVPFYQVPAAVILLVVLFLIRPRNRAPAA